MSRIPGLRLFLVCSALSLAVKTGSADTKVAVINLQRAVLESDEIQKASAAMEAKFKPRQQEMERLQREMQGIQQQLQAGSGKLTQQAEADLTAQGQRKQRDVQRLNEDLQILENLNVLATNASPALPNVIFLSVPKYPPPLTSNSVCCPRATLPVSPILPASTSLTLLDIAPAEKSLTQPPAVESFT